MRSIRDIRRDNLARLVETNGGQSALARAISRDRNQVYQWLRPDSDPRGRAISDAVAREIERALSLSDNWFDQPHGVVDLAGTGAVDASPRPFLRPITIWDDAEDLPPDQFVFFPSLEYRWSCGPGGPDHNAVEETDKSISFTAEWAKKMGWSPKTHLTMRATGESMEPTIQDKAPVVIDTSEAGRTVRSGKVYAIKVNGEPLLKRLDKLPGGRLRVRSDNQSPAYAAFEVADGEIEIVGRAVWTPVNL